MPPEYCTESGTLTVQEHGVRSTTVHYHSDLTQMLIKHSSTAIRVRLFMMRTRMGTTPEGVQKPFNSFVYKLHQALLVTPAHPIFEASPASYRLARSSRATTCHVSSFRDSVIGGVQR